MDRTAARQAARLIGGVSPPWPKDVAKRFEDNLARAAEVVEQTTDLTISELPPLSIVDRASWAQSNIETIGEIFGDFKLSAGVSQFAGWQLGIVLGLASRAVIGQFDPFGRQLLFVGPNLGEFSDLDGARWILFHELTHVAQFEAAPWILDEMKTVGARLVSSPRKEFAKEFTKQLPQMLPRMFRWATDLVRGRDPGDFGPMNLLPEPERQLIDRLNSMMTVLEGHATVVTDIAAEVELEHPEVMEERVLKRRRKAGWMRLVEGLAGLEAKRKQYSKGRTFVERVFATGGNEALKPFFESPDFIPTSSELEDADLWLARVGSASGHQSKI